MYLRHYGLRSKPFKLAHDPAFYYGAAHQIPLNELCYSIEERQGLAAIIGAPGTGKTTLLRRLLQSLAPEQRGIFLSDTALEGESLLQKVGNALGLHISQSQQALADNLFRLLHREVQSGNTVVLLIDEAQSLTVHQLEEVRYLTNLESAGQKLLEIVLAGQPALDQRLASPELAALRQRVAVRSRLEPLDLETTGAYIEHRLMVAGSPNGHIFTPDAVEVIHKRSGGIARLVNIICERCLLVGYVDNLAVLEGRLVEEAVADLKLTPAVEPDTDFSVGLDAPKALGNALDRVERRLEQLENKLDALIQSMYRVGFVRRESPPPSAAAEEESQPDGVPAAENRSEIGESRPAGFRAPKKLPRSGT